jgi:SAM-dependent methyltransferase
VLNWLIAGNDALMLSCLDDERLLHMVLDSLPEVLAEGRGLAIEARVHRWTGAINGLPGGNPVLSLHERHQPDPVQFPGLYVVGDYLFDSTINGVYDSADYVSDLILTRLRKLKYLGEGQPVPLTGSDGQLDRIYHDMYDGSRTYEESLDEYFDEYYVRDLIAAVWGYRPPYKLLDCGSANGLTLLRFEDIGIEAWGIENSTYIHARTPPECRERNILGDVRQLAFPDGSFDFVYETCLCYLAEEDVETAIRELFRVCRIGVFMGGVTSDMMPDVIEQYDIFEGVNTLTTLWDWSEKFIRQGFRIATCDPKVLARAWKIEVKSNEGGSPWYPGAGAMRYCFYSKPDAPAAVVLRFSAFNMRTTPELNGTVVRTGADTTTDQRTGQSYYLVRIAMTADELSRLGDIKLTPGMPVEAFIQTGERTLLSYLVKPMHDQLMRSFREK